MKFIAAEECYEIKLTYLLNKYNCKNSLCLFEKRYLEKDVMDFENDYKHQLRILLEVNQKYLRCYISRFDGDKDDLMQEAMLGIVTSFKRFDPRKGTYYPYARQWMDKYIRVESNKQKYLELLSQSNNYESSMYNGISNDPLDILLSLETESLIDKNVDKLPKKQKKFIMTLLDKKNEASTLSELAKSTCISRSRASQIIKVAGEKIRCAMATN